MRLIIKMLATGFGLGFAPRLSGTIGTLLGIPIFLVLDSLTVSYYFLVVTALSCFAVWVSHRAIPLLPNPKKPGDPSSIIIDEVVGFLWGAGILRYVGFWDLEEGLWNFLVIAFALFRLFDVAKLGPVGWIEKTGRGGLAVVLDDVVAGIIAGITGLLFCILYPLLLHLFYS